MEWILYYYEFGLAYLSLMTIAEISLEDNDMNSLGKTLTVVLLLSWIWPMLVAVDLCEFILTRIESKKG